MKVIIKIDLDKNTNEKEVVERLKYWLLDNFLDGSKAEVEIIKDE